MAQQTLTIGAPSFEDGSTLNWNPPSSPRLIDVELVDGGTTAYLRRFTITTLSTHYQVFLNAADSGQGSGAGPELTTSWEGNSNALTIQAGSLSFTIRGPNAIGVSSSDSTEPYQWFVNNEATERSTFISAYRNLSQAEKDATTLTFDDGVAPPQQALEASLSTTNTVTYSAAITYGAEPVPLELSDLNLEDGEEAVLGFVLQLTSAISFNTASTNQVILDARTGQTQIGTIVAGSLEIDGSVFADDDPVTSVNRLRLTPDSGIIARNLRFHDDSTAELRHINDNHRDELRIVIVTKDISADTTRRLEETWLNAHVNSGSGFLNLDTGILSTGDLWGGSDITQPLGTGDQVLIGWIREAPEPLEDLELEANLDTENSVTYSAEVAYQEATDLELEATLDTSNTVTYSADITYEDAPDLELEATLSTSNTATYEATVTYGAAASLELEATLDTENSVTFSAEITYGEAADQDIEATLNTSNTVTYSAEITYAEAPQSLSLSDLNVQAGEGAVLEFIFELDNAISFSSGDQTLLDRRDGQTQVGTIVAGSLEIDGAIFADDDPVTSVNRLRLVTSGGIAATRLRFHDDQSDTALSHINANHADELRIVVVTEDVSDGTTRRVELDWSDSHASSGGGFLNLNLGLASATDLWAGSDVTESLQPGDRVLVGWITNAPAFPDLQLEATLETDNSVTYSAEITYGEVPPVYELEATLNTANTVTYAAAVSYGEATDYELEATLSTSNTATFSATVTYEPAPDYNLEATLSTSNAVTYSATVTYKDAADLALEATLSSANTVTYSAEITYQAVSNDLRLEASLSTTNTVTTNAVVDYKDLGTQIFVIGAPLLERTSADATSSLNQIILWSPIDAPRLIDSDLVDGGATAYIRSFGLAVRSANDREQTTVQTSSTDSTTGSGAGPDLISGFESNSTALIIRAGGLSLTIPGPTTADVVTADMTEPYSWEFLGGTYDFETFIDSYIALPDADKANTRLIVDGGYNTPLEASLSTTNTVTYSAEVTYGDAPDLALEASLSSTNTVTYSAEITYQAATTDLLLVASLSTTNTVTYSATLTYQPDTSQPQPAIELRASLSTTNTVTYSAEITYKGVLEAKHYGDLLGVFVYKAETHTTNDTDEVKPTGLTNNLFPHYLNSLRETRILDEADILKLEIKRGSLWHLEDVINKNDRILLAFDTSGSRTADDWYMYRVRNIRIGTGEQSEYTVEAWSIDVDLTTTIWGYRVGNSPEFRRAFDFAGFTVREVLDELFGALPDNFVIGSVQSTLSSLEIYPYIENSTISDALGVIGEELDEHEKTLEYEMMVTANGTVNFHFMEARGSNVDERVNGAVDASLRVITGSHIEGDQWSRVGAQVQNVQDDYVSRLVGYGGSDEERVLTGGVAWEIESATVIGGSTTLVLEEGAIHFDDQFVRSGETWGVYDGTNYYQITSCVASTNTIRVTGTVSASATVRFVERSGGNWRYVDYVRRPDGEATQGIVTQLQDFPNVIPYGNLFEGSGDMSEWSSGLPDGVMREGSSIVSRNTEREWITVGKASAKVTADDGDGVVVNVEFGSDPLNPYASACAVLRVEQGSVRMVMEDTDGTTFPLDHEQQHLGLPGRTAALKSEGFNPQPGSGTVKILAKSDDTIFYLDSLAVTQSPTAWAWSPFMGPKAIWMGAGRWMKANGGIRPITTQMTYINLDRVGETIEPIRVGSWVRMKDLVVHGGSDFNLQLDGRIERIDYSPDGGIPYFGGFKRVATIGRQRESIIEMLINPALKRPEPQAFPMDALPEPDAAADLGQGIRLWQADVNGVQTGYIRYTPPDATRVTGFRVAIQTGGLPEPGSETWADVTIANGVYQTSTTLSTKFETWVRYEIQISGADNIVGEASWDIDKIPELRDVTLDWDPSTRDIEASWIGDEDVAGVVYVWNETGDAFTDQDYTDAIADGHFHNGTFRQSVTLDTNTVPGKTVYVGLRPFTSVVSSSTGATDDDNGRVDTLAVIRVPSSGEQPQAVLNHTKSGSVVTVTCTVVSDPADLVTAVQQRTARGRELSSSDTFSNVTGSGNDYSVEVDVSDYHKHTSYVQFKLVTRAGVDDIDLDPFSIDANQQPGALITHTMNYESGTDTYDFRVAWTGDDDCESIRFVLTHGSTTVTYNSNLTASRRTLTTGIDANTAWTLTVTGYTENNQGGSSHQIMLMTGRTPVSPVTAEVDLSDVYETIGRSIEATVQKAVLWSTTVTFSTVSGNIEDQIRWTAGNVQWIEDGGTAIQTQATVARTSLSLGSDNTVYTYIYFDPNSPSGTLRTTTNVSTATSGDRFIMCIAWPSEVDGVSAMVIPVQGTLGASEAVINTNVLTALQASIASLSAIITSTGSLTVSDTITVDEDGVIRVRDDNGVTWFSASATGVSARSLSIGTVTTTTNFTLTGLARFFDNVTMDRDLSVGDDLNVSDDLDVGGDLDVDGRIRLGNVWRSTWPSGGSGVDPTGNVTFEQDVTIEDDLDVQDDARVRGDLQVDGGIELGGVERTTWPSGGTGLNQAQVDQRITDLVSAFGRNTSIPNNVSETGFWHIQRVTSNTYIWRKLTFSSTYFDETVSSTARIISLNSDHRMNRTNVFDLMRQILSGVDGVDVNVNTATESIEIAGTGP